MNYELTEGTTPVDDIIYEMIQEGGFEPTQ